jgi:uncharacterized damage-inducible protein DinB
MNKSSILSLFEYNRWANARVLEAALSHGLTQTQTA